MVAPHHFRYFHPIRYPPPRPLSVANLNADRAKATDIEGVEVVVLGSSAESRAFDLGQVRPLAVPGRAVRYSILELEITFDTRIDAVDLESGLNDGVVEAANDFVDAEDSAARRLLSRTWFDMVSGER